MKRYLTDTDHVFECTRVPAAPCPSTPEMQLVKVYPHLTFQRIAGFGGALTEAAGYVYAQMSPETRKRFIELVFGPSGNRYTIGRLSVQSCDFSLVPRAYLHQPPATRARGAKLLENEHRRASHLLKDGQRDEDSAREQNGSHGEGVTGQRGDPRGEGNAYEQNGPHGESGSGGWSGPHGESDVGQARERLAGFSIDDDYAYVIPLALDALAANPQMEFLASPWSPPAWAKSNRSMKRGGHLRRKHYDTWARMMARFVSEYRALGIPITRLTVQNEPNATQVWESCRFTAEQEVAFLRDHLKPALREAGLADVKVLGWDHNKEGALDRALAYLIDERAAAEFDGIAFHWYSGDHFEALRLLRDLLGPNRELIFSEGCDSYSAGNPSAELPHAEHYAREVIGDLEAGANAILDWNILLDEQGGPNHVGNFCDAPLMYDRTTRTLNVRLPHYYLGHFSRFIQPGAHRILCTRYTTNLETCAFANPDGSHALVALNRTDWDIPFSLTWGSGVLNRRIASCNAPAHSIQTIVW